jgi:hypothetical protein
MGAKFFGEAAGGQAVTGDPGCKTPALEETRQQLGEFGFILHDQYSARVRPRFTHGVGPSSAIDFGTGAERPALQNAICPLLVTFRAGVAEELIGYVGNELWAGENCVILSRYVRAMSPPLRRMGQSQTCNVRQKTLRSRQREAVEFSVVMPTSSRLLPLPLQDPPLRHPWPPSRPEQHGVP